MGTMSELLVSVRSAEEALLRSKAARRSSTSRNRSRGSLGRADDDVIAEIARVVANRRPLSAAPVNGATKTSRFHEWV